MLKEKRFEHILNKLRSAHQVSYEQVAKDLKVSEDTIRRDIDLLHKRGLLVKVRGGAIPTCVKSLVLPGPGKPVYRR
jgi:DeoR/GlpR family transcriptional regulator of sugar metabolism